MPCSICPQRWYPFQLEGLFLAGVVLHRIVPCAQFAGGPHADWQIQHVSLPGFREAVQSRCERQWQRAMRHLKLNGRCFFIVCIIPV